MTVIAYQDPDLRPVEDQWSGHSFLEGKFLSLPRVRPKETVFMTVLNSIQHLFLDFLMKNNLTLGDPYSENKGLPKGSVETSEQTLLRHTDIIKVNEVFHRFLSCYNQSKLSFAIYSKPFGPYVWISLVFAIALLTIFLTIFQSNCGMGQNLFIVIGPMMEEPSHVPRVVLGYTHFSFSFTPWNFVCVVLTVAYTALLMQYMISNQNKQFDTLSDIYCEMDLKVTTNELNNRTQTWKKYSWKTYPQTSLYNNTHCFSVLSKYILGWAGNPYTIVSSTLYDLAMKYFDGSYPAFSDHLGRELSVFTI